LRYGQSAEVLAWGLAFLVQPFIGVFYPIETMPRVFQIVSKFLPPTYVFTELREIVIHKRFSADLMWLAFVMNLCYLFLAWLFFNWLWKIVKDKGYLTRLGNE
jgi:ABC-2 type transport system permease protein